MSRYRFIDRHRDRVPVQELCAVLQVATSSYYAWRQAHIYGHIETDYITEIVKKEIFQTPWNIKKDDISVCKDCEFRYMCTDCRAYMPEGKRLEKPVKCNYDPYTATWQ